MKTNYLFLESFLGSLKKCTLFFILAVLFSLNSVFASEYTNKPSMMDEDWRILIQANNAFNENDYGRALSLVEKSKSSRKQKVNWKNWNLDNVKKYREIQRSGDLLSDIIEVLKKRENKVCLEIVNEEIDKYGISFFDNSFSKLTEFVSTTVAYPEADFLVGKIYRLEGETELALKNYNSAYENKFFLDVPEMQYDILYELADLYYSIGDTEHFESSLLAILKDNEDYSDIGRKKSMNKVLKEDEKETIDKFFDMFRSTDYKSLKALSLLTTFYTNQGEEQKALHAASIGVTTAVQKIYNTLEKRRPGFVYDGIQNLLGCSAYYTDLVEWGKDNCIWELFLQFADCTCSSGYLVFAKELYMRLSVCIPDDYYRKACANRLLTVN